MYSSPNIIMVIKSKEMTWAGHVIHTEEIRNGAWNFSVKNKRKRRF